MTGRGQRVVCTERATPTGESISLFKMHRGRPRFGDRGGCGGLDSHYDVHQASSRRVRRGEITCSVRIWKRPHVTVGVRYRMGEGENEVDSIETDRTSGYFARAGRANGDFGCPGLAQSSEARQRREYLFSTLSLCADSA